MTEALHQDAFGAHTIGEVYPLNLHVAPQSNLLLEDDFQPR